MAGLARVLLATAAVAALVPAGGARADGASLRPASAVVRLDAGTQRRIDYALHLPRRLRPVDVYLLVDTSASMAAYLPALRRELRDGVVRLHRSGADVGFGVGEFGTTGLGDRWEGRTYHRSRAVGPVDGGLLAAVERLGRAEPEVTSALAGEDAHTVALDQSVTGDGHDPYVPPGQDARFRLAASKLVVVVTDAAFAGDPLDQQPGRDAAIASLKAAGAQVVGLALEPAALPDLAAVAAGTGSVSRTAVDCGGSRVQAGRPAACVVSSSRVGATLERLVLDRARIGERGALTFSASGAAVGSLDAPARQVDRSAPARIAFSLVVGCARGDAGRTHAARVTARYAGEVVAQASLGVECG